MSVREITLFGNPVLHTKAQRISDIDDAILRLVQDLKDTLKAQERGIGLAANQIGVLKAVFVYNIKDLGEEGVVINPEIVESDGEWSYTEGCLSVPNYSFDFKRPKRVLLKGIDVNGNEFEREAEDLLARLYQHETDHLNGHLLIERIGRDQRKDFFRKYFLASGGEKETDLNKEPITSNN